MSSQSPAPLAERVERLFPHESQQLPVNVGDGERRGSLVVGGGLLLIGAATGRLPGLLMMLGGAGLVYRGATGHCALYDHLGIKGAEQSARGVRAQHGVKYETEIVIRRAPGELYDYWRKLENLPRVMRHLVSVEERGNNRSRWVASGPLGTTVEWEAEVHNERKPELLAWRSIPGSTLDTAGSIHFESAQGGKATLLRISLKYDPPGGQLGARIADLLGAGLEESVAEDLRRFKSLMEEASASPTP